MAFRPQYSTSSRVRQYESWNRTRLATGYRSQLEVAVAELLAECPGGCIYEPLRIPYEIHTYAHYTPDWILPKQAIILEAKGEFKTSDRQKMLIIKQQYPELDIRILLGSPGTRIGTTSTTTYAMWCEKNGFPWCGAKGIPPEWLKHKPTVKAKKALTTLMKDVGYILPDAQK